MILPPADHGTLERPSWKSVSIRVRCTEIAPWLGRYGTQVHLIIDSNVLERLERGTLDDIELFVIPQTLTDHRPIVDALVAAGKCVIADVCDDVTRYGGILATTWDNARKAAAITVPTPHLAGRLRDKTGVPIHVVHDAVEGPPRPFRGPRTDGPLRLFWYGWQHKVGVLMARLERLRAFAASTRPIHLTVMSDVFEIREEMAALMTSGDDALSIDVMPWSIEDFDNQMEDSDLALIPFGTSIDFSGRSPLKLMQALWQGRLAISEDLESYPDFARFDVLHGDIVDGIRYINSDPKRAVENLRVAQIYIRDTYLPSVLAKRWQRIFADVLHDFHAGK